MSFEPETTDIILRQLREEIAKIREEQFVSTLPTNNVSSASGLNAETGVPVPYVGVTSIIPAVIRISKDDGEIDLLDFDDKNANKDFTIGETITGQSSGATAEVGDIDTLTDTTGTLTLVPGSITGTFNDNENLNGSGAGGNNIADADGSQYTQTGRGHLNAGAGSIIADRKDVSSPFEIHFIDNAQQDGQTIYLRAQDGQTIRIRRALTADSTTGNLDLDESFDIVENAIVFFQYQVASNASGTGGWVPLITDVSSIAGGGGGDVTFPILYPKENLGTTSGVIDLSLNESEGHYKQITLDGDASLTFSNLPPSVNGFKFYVLTIQDGTGGHVYTDLPDSVLFENSLLGQLQTAPNSQTLWQFSTADGGVNWHASVINPVSAGQNQTPWEQPIDADNFDLFNAKQIRFSQIGNGFSCPTDSTVQGMSGGILGIEWNVSLSQDYKWLNSCKLFMQLERNASDSHSLIFFDEGLIDRTAGITFSHINPIPALSSIRPFGLELEYSSGHGTGQGGFHGFRVANPTFPQFEIREDVVRSNVNFDMVTNNIINVDQILFHDLQGFNNATDHGERRLTGGDAGINMNLPVNSPFPNAFTIWFEEDTLDRSNPYYQFKRDALIMGTGVGDCTRAPVVTGAIQYQLCRGGGIFDFGTRTSLRSATVSSVPATEQLLELVAGATKKVEFTNTEDGPAGVGGGMKMFTDLNMQTHNINNIDVATWEPDVGTGIAGLGNGAYGIVADDTKSLTLGLTPGGVNRPLFLFHAPRDQVVTSNDPAFAWGKMHIVFATLDEGAFHIRSNETNVKPLVISDGGFQYGVAYQPVDNPFIDGESRLINNAGSLDVVYRTGGNLVNLSDLTAGAGNLDIDNDLGDVSGPLFIDWNVSNFHRMRLVGDVTIIMVGLPTSPDWQEITVEFLQDPTGGHEVTFLDIFRNTPVPVIRGGANRYTIVKFYSYRDVFDNILTWQPEYLTNSEEAQGSINQGMIHVKLNTDQQSDLGVGNHIEWRTILFTNNMTVSSGAGQSAGIFSGFKTSRTYECTASLGVDKTAVGEGAITYQWYDIAQAQFIGTQGTAQDPSEDNPYQPTAKAFFQAFDTSDTVELRITSQTGNPIDTIYSGFPEISTAQTPESFAEIKDCGQTQSQFEASEEELIDEDTILLPQNPPFIFSSKSTIYTQYQKRNPYSNVGGTIVNAEVIIPFQHGSAQIFATTLSDFALVNPTGQLRAGTFGFLTRTRMDIAENTLNKAINVNFFKNGSQLGTIFTIGAGQTGSANSTGNVRIVAGDKWSYSFQTTDGLIPSGFMTWAISTDIEWGVV